MVFVNSMSDLYHEKVPSAYVRSVFDTMKAASWHKFQVLTKRAKRLLDLSQSLDWAPNIWQGVSVESREADVANQRTSKSSGQSQVSLVGTAPRPTFRS